jgi:CRISPR/Cas system CMR-associated protein Cmr5 small subunit
MLGLPVVTINKEYKQEFGSWNQNSNTLSLLEELDAFLACDAAKVKNVCSIRRKKAIDKHSLGVWVLKVLNFLGDDSRA